MQLEPSGIGKNLERLRIWRNLSVSELMRVAGIPRQTYYGILRSDEIDFDTASRLAFALSVAVAELIKSGPTAPSPNEVAIHRLRDLLEWDGGDGPERMRKAIEVAWMERFGSTAERRSCREVEEIDGEGDGDGSSNRDSVVSESVTLRDPVENQRDSQ